MTRLIANPTVFDLGYLCERMREDERDQFCALNGHATFEPDVAARQLAALPGISFALLDEGSLPIAAGGFVQVRPMVWQSWMVGTDAGWEAHWRDLTKACKRVMRHLFEGGNCHRIETVCLASRTKAGRWYMKSLGETFEGVQRAWFPDGRDAAWYAKVKESPNVP